MDKSLSIKISLDGNQWCVLAGENLQEGFAGFGNTKEEAWHALGKELFGVPCVCQDCTCDGCKRSKQGAARLDIEARHAEEMRTREDSYLVALGQKSNRIDDQAEELEKLRAELAALREKMAGMVCGTCLGVESERKDCQVCQPAKEGK